MDNIEKLKKAVQENPTAENQEKLAMAELQAKNYSLPHKVPLQEPIQVGSQEITEITFQNRLRASYIAHLPVGSLRDMKFGNLFPLISKMTGELPETIDELGFQDLTECVQVVSYFLKPGPVNGVQKS